MPELYLSDLKIFQYPEFIFKILEDIVSIFIKNFGEENIEAIVLHGSAAKGELTINGIQLYSDLEFFIFVRRKINSANPDKIREYLADLKNKYRQTNPFFYIDFVVKSGCFLPLCQKNFLIYELKKSGKVLFGNKRILDKLPAISPFNVNLKAVNDIFLMRLIVFLKDFKFEAQDEFSVYSLFKNHYQYLSAVVLANEGVLFSSSCERYGFIKENKERFKAILGEDFISALEISTKIKSPRLFSDNNKIDFSYLLQNFGVYQIRFIDHFFMIAEHLFRKGGELNVREDNFLEFLDKAAINPFNDNIFDIFSLAAYLRLIVCSLSQGSFLYILKIFNKPIKKKLVLSSLSLCLSLKNYLIQKPYKRQLELSCDFLNQISCRKEKLKLTNNFKTDFDSLRLEIINIFSFIF